MKFQIYLFFLILSALTFAISSSGGAFTQNIKMDSFADNSTSGGYSQRTSGTTNIVGTLNGTQSRFGVLDFVNHAPNVTALLSPANASTSTSTTVVFQFNVTDDFSLNNCSLWTDVTGTFAQTQVNTTAVGLGSTNNISYTFASDGTYTWNIQCIDTALDVQPSYSSSYTSNYTIIISTSTASTTTPQPLSSGGSIKSINLVPQTNLDNLCAPGNLSLNITSEGRAVWDVNVVLLHYNSFDTLIELNRKTTNDSGQVSFNFTDPGTYQINTIKSGHSPGELKFNITNCQIFTIVNTTNNTTNESMIKSLQIDLTRDNYTINATILENFTTIDIFYRAKNTETKDMMLKLPLDFSDYENNLVSIGSNLGSPTTIENGSIIATWKNLHLNQNELFTISIKILKQINTATIEQITLNSIELPATIIIPPKKNETVKGIEKEITPELPPTDYSIYIVGSVLFIIILLVVAFVLKNRKSQKY